MLNRLNGRWRWAGALALALAAASGSAPACAQDVKDPDTALKELNTWYQAEFTKARQSNDRNAFAEIAKQRTEKAKEAVKGVEVDKVEPAKSYALAQLFQAAGDQSKMVAAARRFLTSNPEPQPKYAAQNLVLTGMMAQADADGIVAIISEMKPPAPSAAAMLATMTGARYAEIVVGKKGAQAGLDLLAKVESLVPFDEMLKKPDVSGPNGQPQPAPERSSAEQAIVYLAQGRSDILEKSGKKDEALATLEAAKAKLPAGSRNLRGLESKIKLAKIVGMPAPELKQDRGYGDFKSLSEYKGKVVVVEFTAHW